MEEIITSTNPAYSTSITMILLLGCIIIKQLATLAEVFTHAYTTINTNLLNLLFSATERTYHLVDFMPRNVMPKLLININIVHCLVMTVTTIKDLIATGSSNAAPSSIVLASILHESFPQQFGRTVMIS